MSRPAACLVALVAVLGGCAGLPEVQIPKEVKIPVPVACISPQDAPKVPAVELPADLMAKDTYQRTLGAWAAFLKLSVYRDQAAAVIEGCSRIPAADSAARLPAVVP